MQSDCSVKQQIEQQEHGYYYEDDEFEAENHRGKVKAAATLVGMHAGQRSSKKSSHAAEGVKPTAAGAAAGTSADEARPFADGNLSSSHDVTELDPCDSGDGSDTYDDDEYDDDSTATTGGDGNDSATSTATSTCDRRR